MYSHPKRWYIRIFNIRAFIAKKGKQVERTKHTGIAKGKRKMIKGPQSGKKD